MNDMNGMNFINTNYNMNGTNGVNGTNGMPLRYGVAGSDGGCGGGGNMCVIFL